MNTAQLLLVDDDLLLLQALPQTILLRTRGVEVATTSSAEEALALIQKHDYDAIISDIKMPGMDGLDLLSKVYELYPDTPVLLITGHGEYDLAVRALRGGAYDYIQKPIDRDAFIAALQRALQTRQLRQQVRKQRQALEHYALSLERMVEQRTRELACANTEKDRFVGMVVHELSSPLTSAMGLTQMMQLHLQQPDPLRKMGQDLEYLEHALRRLHVLVRDLQDVSLIQTDHFVLHHARCDLCALCRCVLEEYALTNNDSPPTFEAAESSLEADVDGERISQVLLNLLTNARKYSAEGAPIQVTLRRAGEQGVISVRDWGIGIPADQLAHIYEPFYRVPGVEGQTGASSTGLGLGLAIASTIIEHHGGHIEVDSTPGEGSTFSLVLPLVTSHDRAE